MSTDYMTEEKVRFIDVFDGRLERFGVREHICPGKTSDTYRCLTDGRNFVWLCEYQGTLGCITRYGANVPQKILVAIAEAFETDIFSEHQPQFWGFETQAAWDRAMDALNKRADDAFYADVVRFIRGEPNRLRARSVGMRKAEIAKDLVGHDPSLLSPDKREELMAAVSQKYKEVAAVIVTLSDRDMALVKMLETDDLPKA
jgi:hypothetical protein